MLVVTANWSITDGTLVDPPARPRIAEFLAGIRRSAARAGVRRDGGYRPVERVDVILAGDTFDWLVSAAWLGEERPWQRRARRGAARERVMQAAAKRGMRLLVKLGRLASDGLMVAAADGRGRPVLGSHVRVPVRVALLAGDRDAWLDERRSGELARRFGIVVGRSWTDHPVTVVHGHETDPLCGPAWDAAVDRPPTLHESLSVDLLARFTALVHEAEPAASGRRGLEAIAAAHPLDAPRRLQAWLERAGDLGTLSPAMRGRIEAAWGRAVDGWQRRARRDVPSTELQFDAVETVAHWLRVARAEPDAPFPASLAPIAVPAPGPAEEPTTVVFGHPPTGSAGFAEAVDSRVICLGPDPVRRSRYCEGVGGDVVRDAMIVPQVGAFDTRPKTATLFEPGEAGGADWSTGLSFGSSAEQVRPTPVRDPWIVDAA